MVAAKVLGCLENLCGVLWYIYHPVMKIYINNPVRMANEKKILSSVLSKNNSWLGPKILYES